MHYHIITIFPELFDSFLGTSLIAKACEKKLLEFSFVNPRDFCTDPHQQVDDEIYGGGVGMLMKAQPVIDAIKNIMRKGENEEMRNKKIKVVLLGPSNVVFNQAVAHELADEATDIVFICGRYEGIDHRVQLRCAQEFGPDFSVVSIGQYVTLGGEVPAMVMIEAISRLLPGVIKETESRKNESYRPELGGENIEHPHYTRPEVVEGFAVPEVLLSGHHAEIEKRKKGGNN